MQIPGQHDVQHVLRKWGHEARLLLASQVPCGNYNTFLQLDSCAVHANHSTVQARPHRPQHCRLQQGC